MKIKIPKYIKRMGKEKAELRIKTINLVEVLSEDKIELDEEEKEMLRDQLKAMIRYNNILATRIEYAIDKEFEKQYISKVVDRIRGRKDA